MAASHSEPPLGRPATAAKAVSATGARSRQPAFIVAHQKSLAAPHLAEALDIPHVRALAVPMLTPTRAFAVPGLVRRILGGLLNRASYRLVGLLSRPYSGLIRSWRGDSVDLAPRGKPPAAAKTLYCYSPSLVPTPADWPPDAVATGYWLREHTGANPVDPALDGFVAAGAPPIYIGFGSSVGSDPARLGAVVSDAVRRAGIRAVIASGWGAMSHLRSDSDTFVVESVPHHWLFPWVAAVVHHGGAGTTAAGGGGPSECHLPLPGRPVFLGRRCPPSRCRVSATGSQHAHSDEPCIGDPRSDR
jgi:sterol 3beta-glucosyltransferase